MIPAKSAQHLLDSADASLKGMHIDGQDALNEILKVGQKPGQYLNQFDRMKFHSRIKDIKTTVALIESYLKL